MAEHLQLDAQSPWPGLASFGEGDQPYFRGREREADELARLVRRERLTVLFGRSGLGKSSLLAAGLFPRLRSDLHLPLVVRIGYAAQASPRQQVWDALAHACAAAGVQAPPPEADESLWAYFHRAGAGFWNLRRRPLLPVLVFDQFEEVFTLGQESEASRQAAQAFLDELADLIEDRPSEALRQVLDSDPARSAGIDFERRGCKVLLSFREDFLPDVEGLRGRIPSLIRNRFRLLPMDAAQAREVIASGGALVGPEVAERIVGLAWRNQAVAPTEAELPRVEVDPALLSVICSELNLRRRAAGAARIEPGLLAGAEREILVDFYERSLKGLAPEVRLFVEDRLVSATGYRANFAYNEALALPGVSRVALDSLVAGRLLRLDERFGQRQLELTHDVLTRVVMGSRDQRLAREAEAALKLREAAAAAAQRRNRQVFAGVVAAVVMALVLLGWAGWQTNVAMAAVASANELKSLARSSQWLAAADRLPASEFDRALLVRAEALRTTPNHPDALGELLTPLLRPNRPYAYLSSRTKGVTSVAFSLDGKRLALGTEDSTVIVWDLDSRKPLATLKGHKGNVQSVAFSPDGKRLASSADKTVILWDLDKLKPVMQPLATLEAHHDEVWSIAFSPDGKRLASANEDQTVTLWDLDSRKPLATLKGHKDRVWSVAFSPDGKRLASSADKTVILWGLESLKPVMQPLATLEGHKDQVFGVTFSPDGMRLASASSDNTVILWDLDSLTPVVQPLATLEGHKDSVLSVAFSPDGQRLASASGDKTVLLWDLASPKPVLQPLATLEGHKTLVWSVVFSTDGKRLASADNDSTVILWDLDNRRPMTKLEEHKRDVLSVAFSPDGKRLASASADKTVILWDLESRKPLVILEGHKDGVSTLAFSPDSRRLASSADKTVFLWGLDSLKPVMQPLAKLEGHKAGVYSVAFSPDGKQLASASADPSVILWDLENLKPVMQPLATLAGHKDPFSSVAFSPDGKRLASASWDKTVILWDVASRQPMATLEGHNYLVLSVAFSPDGKWLASASADKTVILWDVASGKPLATFEGHKDQVQSVAFSPDGKRLASASSDKTVILWDVASRKPLATLEGRKGDYQSVAFSPDGKRLASAGADNTVVLWDLDPAHLLDQACQTVGRNLSCSEWRDSIGANLPYRLTCPAFASPAEACK